MAAPTPRMHGLTHTPGGPDPIPGIGAGGALEWEDVGIPATGRYVMFRGNNILLSGGVYSLGWVNVVSSYDPAGNVAAMDPADAASLLLKSAGVFKIELVVYVTSGPTGNMRLTLNGTAVTALTSNTGLAVYDPATPAACLGVFTSWVSTTTATGKIKIGITPASGFPDHTLCVSKMPA
jgi:hypothetical protein